MATLCMKFHRASRHQTLQLPIRWQLKRFFNFKCQPHARPVLHMNLMCHRALEGTLMPCTVEQNRINSICCCRYVHHLLPNSDRDPHAPPQPPMVVCWCAGSPFGHYFVMFLLFLTKDQQKENVEFLTTKSIQRNVACNFLLWLLVEVLYCRHFLFFRLHQNHYKWLPLVKNT